MKRQRVLFGVAIGVFVAIGLPSRGGDKNAANLAETLAWLKRVDGELIKPRYANLTLEQMSSMTELRLGGHRKSDKKHLYVNPAEMKYLIALAGLKKLNLGENDGATDEALAHVGKLVELNELVLWDAPMTDAGVKHLAGLKELTDLDLAFATKLTTAAVAEIARLPKLERLNLAGTQVKDVSGLASVASLKQLKLGKLKPAGVENLKKSIPGLVIK